MRVVLRMMKVGLLVSVSPAPAHARRLHRHLWSTSADADKADTHSISHALADDAGRDIEMEWAKGGADMAGGNGLTR